MPLDQQFLGTGWSFPPAFDRALAQVKMTTGVEDIKRSLEIIFTTALGERIMNPKFGCSLNDRLFEPMDSSGVAYIKNLLKTAILYHEPRIDADKIDVQPNAPEGVLWISIDYTVRESNSRFNFVYPFYLTTGGV
ncbi:MAG TPA: GPW/gp25 family protein [Candidatus Deferrimicrobium sp.]|nr:GPW/gp25 family protein [Candidatus Deferrimicrobium sp.]